MVSSKTIHQIRFIVGIAGNIISCGLFLSPFSTFKRICKKKDVEEFQPYPYLATVLNCLFWVVYGLPVIKPDSILVLSINGFGLVVELIYITIFIIYAKDKKMKRNVVLGLVGEFLLTGAVAATAILRFHTHKPRFILVGVFCDIFNVIMYGSPLAIMFKVIKTKSVEFMPLALSVANALNGACWTAYACIQLDVVMLISNGLGCLSGLIQLILYWWYYKTTPKHKDGGDVKPSEIQLPTSTAASMVCEAV